MPDFTQVGSISDLKSGECKVVEVKGRAIALCNANDQFYALDNSCLHHGGPLGEGYVDCNNLTIHCPWHGWIFNLSDGSLSYNPNAKVQTFEVRVEGEAVLVAVD